MGRIRGSYFLGGAGVLGVVLIGFGLGALFKACVGSGHEADQTGKAEEVSFPSE